MTVPRGVALEIVRGEQPGLRMHIDPPDHPEGRILLGADGVRVGETDRSADPDEDLALVRRAFGDALQRIGLPPIELTTVGDYLQVMLVIGHLLPVPDPPGDTASLPIANPSSSTRSENLRILPILGVPDDTVQLLCRACIALFGIEDCPRCRRH